MTILLLVLCSLPAFFEGKKVTIRNYAVAFLCASILDLATFSLINLVLSYV